MTLVLSMVTEEFLVQVSDRRLTRNGTLVTDRARKALVLGMEMAVGYTGQAVLGSTRTDLWIANALSEAKTLRAGRAVVALKDALQAEFQRLGLRARQEIVCVGWVRRKPADQHEPFVARISNFHSLDGKELRPPTHEFTYRITVADRPKVILYRVTGQLLASEVRLARLLTTSLKRGVGQQGITQLFAWAIRRTAERNSLVGRDLIATSIPFSAREQGASAAYVVKGGPSESDAAFMDLKENRKADWHSPHVVLPGVVMSDIRLERSQSKQ